MQEAEWTTPGIPGLTYDNITFHPENPVKGDRHSRVHDGWLEITIKCDGSNPFYPEERFWGYTFIRVSEGPPINFNGVPNMRYCTITPEEELLGGHIEETWYRVPNKGTIFGLWLNFGVRPLGDQDWMQRKGSLLYPLPQSTMV